MGRAFSFSTLWLVAVLATASACAPRSTVYRDFEAHRRDSPKVSASRVTILFLVDGLSVPILKRSLAEGRLPALNAFFLRGEGRFRIARSVFPSLTYPNIASVLTGLPVDRHPVIGNQMFLPNELSRSGVQEGSIVDYESPLSARLLNDTLAPLSAAHRLALEHRKSASFAYVFAPGATVAIQPGLQDALAYRRGRYAALDEKLLDSAERLLDGTDPERWPSFIFIHLIGVDALAHRDGPEALSVREHLGLLDARMRPLLRAIERGERAGIEVATVLTGDHGSTPTPRYIPGDAVFKPLFGEATVLNQGRLAVVHFRPATALAEREAQLERALRAPGVFMTIQRVGNALRVRTRLHSLSIHYRKMDCGDTPYGLAVGGAGFRCPRELDALPAQPFAPFFATSVASYFHSPYHPDAVVLAEPGVNFKKGDLAGHGGITPDEMTVPLLLRGAAVAAGTIPPTHALLAEPLSRSRGLAEEPIVGGPLSDSATQRVRTRLELTIPSGVSQVRATDGVTGAAYQTGLARTLGVTATYRAFLDERFSAAVSGSTRLQSSSGLPSLSRFAVAGSFHFDRRKKITLEAAQGQEYFPVPASAEAWSVDRSFVPEFSIGTESRFASLWLGDLIVGGKLALLGADRARGDPLHAGFKQGVFAALEHPVGREDMMRAGVELEHFRQDADRIQREGFGLSLGLSYGFSF